MDIHEFTETLGLFIGNSCLDHREALLLYARFASPKIAYMEFCRMLVPENQTAANKLLSRIPRDECLTEETL